MSSVSSSSIGAGTNRGAEGMGQNCRIVKDSSVNFSGNGIYSEKSKVLKKYTKRIARRKHTRLWVCVVLPLVFSLLCSFPEGCNAGKSKKDNGSKNGNFSLTPTNHEEVLSRNKEIVSSSDTVNDDYWVGTHKLEFKPHPLLMPSTHSPSSHIPIPIIELGIPPTTSPAPSSSESGGVGGEVDDLSESASTNSEEERKGKGKTRKSRGGRKKSRDQRRMAHRTLWARQNAASNNTSNAYTRALPHNPYFLHNHHQIQQQPSPMILTAGSMMSSQNQLLIPPQNSRNDESFHGNAATWNINHPGNGIIAPNLLKGYLPSNSEQQNSAQVTSSSSQETSQQVQQQFPPPLQQIQYGYPQFSHPYYQHQQHLFAQQIAAQQHQQSQQIPLQMPPLAQVQHSYPVVPSGPEYHPQQSGVTPVMYSGSNGPMLMYVGPGGLTAQGGIGQMPSASGPIPVKPFNINDISGAAFSPHLQYNQITGPDHSGGHQHSLQHPQQGGSSSSSGGSTNPQYLRNNFIRMVMDKMANVGRMLPIPFVTKYASSPSQNSHHQQIYGSPNHFNRRMKK